LLVLLLGVSLVVQVANAGGASKPARPPPQPRACYKYETFDSHRCHHEGICVFEIPEFCIMLQLTNDKLRDVGAFALAEAIERGTNVHTLILTHNSITGNGTVRLAQALKSNKLVHTLVFGDNPIGHDGIAALADMLKVNHHMRVMSLAHSAVDAADGEVLVNAVEGHAGLHHLHLTETKVSDEHRARIEARLATNRKAHQEEEELQAREAGPSTNDL